MLPGEKARFGHGRSIKEENLGQYLGIGMRGGEGGGVPTNNQTMCNHSHCAEKFPCRSPTRPEN